jgi:hypothetical protein
MNLLVVGQFEFDDPCKLSVNLFLALHRLYVGVGGELRKIKLAHHYLWNHWREAIA